MDKKVTIIGAGIAGLSAGVYLQINGYEVTIYEQHTVPGGNCAFWHKKGYTIDGCMKWLMGSDDRQSVHQIWKEIGALVDDSEIIYTEMFSSIVLMKENKVLHLPMDFDKAEQTMVEFAPEDEGYIRSMFVDLRKISSLDLPVSDVPKLQSLWSKLLYFRPISRLLFTFYRLGKRDFNTDIDSLKNEDLRKAFKAFVNGMEISTAFAFSGLALPMCGKAGYLKGGSERFVRNIEKRFKQLGGKVKYKSQVTRILVEDDVAVGVQLQNESEIRSDFVISAIDMKHTFEHLVDPKYFPIEYAKKYERASLAPTAFFCAFGVNKSAEWFEQQGCKKAHSGELLSLTDEESIEICGRKIVNVNVFVHNHDLTLAPEGKMLVTVLIISPYDDWIEYSAGGKEKYYQEKKRVEEQVLGLLERRYPGFTDAVEMSETASPITWERYTRAWKGAYMGFIPENLLKSMPLSSKIKNMFLCGIWTQISGGLPPAAMSGRHACQLICHSDGKKFKTCIS